MSKTPAGTFENCAPQREFDGYDDFTSQACDPSKFPSDAPVEVIKLMQQQPPFALRGSRLMGGFFPNSDWDLMCEDTETNRESLVSMGFYADDEAGATADYGIGGLSEGNPGYCRGVYYKYSDESDERIQVVIVHRVEDHLHAAYLVWKYLYEMHLKTPKGPERKAIWTALLDALTSRAVNEAPF